jgi:hypothetical protein
MGGTNRAIRLFSSALAMAAAALGAGCSGLDYSSGPTSGGGDPLVSAEDLALQTTGVSLARIGDYQVLRATGTINAGVTQYRALLGIQNLNTAGEQPAGRREINWDGASAALTNVDTFPKDFFNVKSPRGVLFSTNGTGFRVSDATGLSFVGVAFDSPKVSRVRIVSGDAALSATAVDLSHGTGKVDLVALDDFIYGEPHARVQAAGAR